MSVDALILDFGEVLVHPQPAPVLDRMARLAGLPVNEFTQRYWEHRDAYDSGLPAIDYWKRVLGTAVDSIDSDTVFTKLIDADCESWTFYREPLWDATLAYKTAGGRTAMLSNGVPEVMGRVRQERQLQDYFDAVVVSYEVGVIKPNPAIYRICLDRLGTAASKALFVDDRVVNIQAATALGLQTLHFTGDESVEALSGFLS
jgi:putative hydrolase of the HAD superfamily